MVLKFCKMHGIGNDYIYFDCLKNELANPSEIAIKLSDRHFGIGGDGIVLICKSTVADAKMRMFNLDGSEGKMCGNAIRCVGKYLYDNHIIDKPTISIDTLSGIKYLDLTVENGEVTGVKVDMGKPILTPADIPVNLTGSSIVDKEVAIDGQLYNITCVSMGNPHCIVFVDNVDSLDLEEIGPRFEYNQIFPDQVNTEFVECLDDGTFKMRVWERGSGETLACGTGACAVAVAMVLNNKASKNQDIIIHLKGGDLTINYTDETVYMSGSATKVFDGIIDL
ncbi:diaminopimelate epimerase [Candidatus Epulonipiscium fishelsonii]|uniref:Diaminopimelate epimerase n=1 Tax=Candidatus Epulonipiscium fishelsonii TaxID=77094 RepID=A0ACC8XEE3_9FIRM|nr:diaminopimelate epimerase [Epulopiscium sp. SCG-B11WGA-EpuloA1]ONI43687.1 diaminopimelate epimerase [Epulopiscium sp. SCG-B05WGA-EpuloA1]